jgi:hypothetical protein
VHVRQIVAVIKSVSFDAVDALRLIRFWAAAFGPDMEIIADPGTWQFQGYQFLGDGRDVRAPGAWAMAVLRQARVSAPGTRPPEQPAPSNV